MRNGYALSLSLCLLTASTAIAHDTQPTGWCPANNTVTLVAQFDLTPQVLADYRALHINDGQVLGSECSNPKSCGIVDDWFWANEAANAACTSYQLRNASPAPAMPFVSYPATFNLDGDANHNGIRDHHDQYAFKSGLKGMCVVCRPPATSVPAVPGAKR